MIFVGRLVLFKIIELAGSLIILIAASFLLLKLLPGGPFHDDTALHPLVRQNLLMQWQIDQSWYEQFFSYLKALLKGDWGVSMTRPDQKVSSLIGAGVYQTLSLGVISLVVTIIGSFALSITTLRYRESRVEALIDQFVLAAISLPSLFWGPFLIFFFGFYLNWLPIAFLQTPASFILPVLTLCFRPLGTMTRILKRSLEENILEDYVRTAEAKGLEPSRILIYHVLRNSLIPFLAYLGPLTAGLFSGSFLVEILYSIPGLGSEFAQALSERDYTVILGLTLFYGILLVVINGICDIVMKWSDPRIKGVL